jgi:glycosyltransferase involved in cell wall biosynthesis
MGRLSSHKGLGALLEAAEALEADAGVHVHVAGSGPLKDVVREATDRLDNVTFHGFLGKDALRKHLQESDVLVFPSVCLESFGMAIVEAFAVGLPVIATDIGGQAELVEEGVNGYKFAPGNVSQLAGILRRIAADPSRIERMKLNAIKAAEPYTVGSMSAGYKSVYEELRK